MEWAKIGSTVLMFIVWYYTFKLSTESQKETMNKNAETVDQLTRQMVQAYQDSLASHRDQNKVLQSLIKDQQENEAHMIQILTQLKERLNQPVKCPIAESQKINRTD
jgi:hypothetical protein